MCADNPDERLVERACGGDEQALKVLLARSRPQLYEYVALKIRAGLASVVDPDDVVQQTHVLVFRRLDSLKTSRPQSFHRWVRTIAVNQLRNTVKRHRTAKRGGGRLSPGTCKRTVEDSTVELFDMLAGPDRTPSRSAARGEVIQAVQDAISDLPEHYQRAVRLVHIEGYTVPEAAKEMGRTGRAVEGLCRRGLKRLQKRLVSASRFFSSAG